jgi:Uma2 family endonuclease
MGMPIPQAISTIEELFSLPPDGLRHELLAGEHVVTPSPGPRHQRAVFTLYEILVESLRKREDLEVLGGPADIRIGPDTLVQPDLFILKSDPRAPIEDWARASIPLLVVEVVSPSSAQYDRGKKRRLYIQAGVEEYWIVDTDARLFERWSSGYERPEMADTILEWSLSVGAHGSIDVQTFFRCALRL